MRSSSLTLLLILATALPAAAILRPANLQADFVRGTNAGPLPDSPDFWWKLDETSGLVASNSGSFGTPANYDLALTDYNLSAGTYQWLGSASTWGPALIEGGIRLTPYSGSDFYYFALLSSIPLQGRSTLTVAYWSERDSALYDERAFSSAATWNEGGHQFMVGNTSSRNQRSRINGATYLSALTYPLNTKTHFTWVLDFTRADSDLRLYVNGSLADQWLLPGVSIDPDSSYPGLIQTVAASPGNTSAARSNPIRGSLADLRIYLRALDDTEVSNLYSTGAP